MKDASAAAVAAIVLAAGLPIVSVAQEQAGRDACLVQLRTVGGPDAANGIDVLDTEFSQAGTLVTMRDAGGTVWECIGYQDGAVGDLRVVSAADDGEGAMSANTAREGTEGDGETTTEVVRFPNGMSGKDYRRQIAPGGSHRYVLNARAQQFLTVDASSENGQVSYQIFNPDGSFLLDMLPLSKSYYGQLWQSGDHIVEFVNLGQDQTNFYVLFAIE
ncbi:hypothetical protein R5H30_01150 [Sulfitobacter sp. D35]|uniref:hypothetical protein n=1 Tax=Sulfitobacter sp. D35 TaxID=3083252 RepID=UPI00296E821F|nr:hypothetical protein [Sulfitobacter sp. D35]MDW4496571.1 hypothetical protein [Sulfitobacter sp. D35]